MSISKWVAATVLTSTMTSPVPVWAFGAGAGCADLPEYYRAQGALQGMPGACDMSVEQARRIVAAQDGPAAVYGPAPATTRSHRKRHRASEAR